MQNRQYNMKSHELAYKLLELPNVKISVIIPGAVLTNHVEYIHNILMCGGDQPDDLIILRGASYDKQLKMPHGSSIYIDSLDCSIV